MPVINMPTLASLLSALALASAYRVAPPTTPAADAHHACAAWHIAQAGESFHSIARSHRLDIAQFKAYNPAVCVDTDTLVPGASYCVNHNHTPTPPPVDAATTPDCTARHAVTADDTCFGIAGVYGLSLGQFYAMNPALGTRCRDLVAGQYVCVAAAVTAPLRTQVVQEEVLPPRCFFNMKQAGHAHYICVPN